MKIVIISGTNRRGNMSLKVSKMVQARYQAKGVDAEIIDLCDMPAEIYSPDAYSQKPESFSKYSDLVLESDGLVVVVPEYNGSFPGALKYFIDMLPFPEAFENRSSAFIGIAAGIWGGLRSVEQLQQVFGYRNGFSFNERVFVPGIYKEFDEENQRFKTDLIDQLLDSQTENFISFVRNNGKNL